MKQTIVPQLNELASLINLEGAANQGDLLSPESARVIEIALGKNPLDLANRARLLGFYYRSLLRRRTKKSELYETNRVQHILWFIKNIPDCTFCSDFYFAIKNIDSIGFGKIASAWKKSLRQNSANKQIAINAAMFFMKHDLEKSSNLVSSVLKADPKNFWALSILNCLQHGNDGDDEVYNLSERLAVRPKLSASKLVKYCDSACISQSFVSNLGSVSAETLNHLLEKYPCDVNARACLVAYYGSHCALFNTFAADPEFERLYVLHLGWFIKFAPAAEALESVRFPELTLRAKNTLLQLWNEHKSKDLNKIATGNKEYFRKWLKVQSDAERVASLRERRKRGFAQNVPGLLDSIAVTCDKPRLGPFPFPKKYGLTECSNDSHLQDAKLIGSHSWFADGFALRLNEIMGKNSIDLYHRAMIIGFCYPSEKQRLNTPLKSVLFKKHMQWLIMKCPGSTFFQEFYWDDIEKVDARLNAELHASWLRVMKTSSDSTVSVNACLAHFSSDKPKAKKIINKVLAAEPENAVAKALAARLADPDEDYSPNAILDECDFQSGSASERLTKVFRLFEAFTSVRLGRAWPERSIWTLEQVIKNNPNDLNARSEILGFFSKFRFCNALVGRDPVSSRRHQAQQIWLIKNAPEISAPSLLGADYGKDKSGCIAIATAWKRQIAVYPFNPQIAINASRTFSSHPDLYLDGIKVLKSAVSKNPRNQILKERLSYLLECDKQHKNRLLMILRKDARSGLT